MVQSDTLANNGLLSWQRVPAAYRVRMLIIIVCSPALIQSDSAMKHLEVRQIAFQAGVMHT